MKDENSAMSARVGVSVCQSVALELFLGFGVESGDVEIERLGVGCEAKDRERPHRTLQGDLNLVGLA